MTYFNARECFQDIKNHITAESDPVSYDLSSGLLEFLTAIQIDLQEMKQKIDQIETHLQQMK